MKELSVRETAWLLWGYYRRRMNYYERTLLKKLLDGITGAGELTDLELSEILSDKQIAFIKGLGKRFRILNKI